MKNKKLWTITGSLTAAAAIVAGTTLANADNNNDYRTGTAVTIPQNQQNPTTAPSVVTASTVRMTPTEDSSVSKATDSTATKPAPAYPVTPATAATPVSPTTPVTPVTPVTPATPATAPTAQSAW